MVHSRMAHDVLIVLRVYTEELVRFNKRSIFILIVNSAVLLVFYSCSATICRADMKI